MAGTRLFTVALEVAGFGTDRRIAPKDGGREITGNVSDRSQENQYSCSIVLLDFAAFGS